ncbi:MAG: patatin-like phospholipase family protein [bacterium]|nr:patatin-like phospholipase family protein [bacterium]
MGINYADNRFRGEKMAKIGLALSGGGALGVAHIGMLRELDRHGIRPEFICGTSAGAIIGLLYAASGLPGIEGFLADMENEGLFKSRSMILAGPENWLINLKHVLHRHVAADSFDDFKTNFNCVATDIVTGEMVVLNEGNPIDAVLVSASFPGIFPVRRMEERLLVDGGIVRNVPGDVLRESGADFVIGSLLYSPSLIRSGERPSPPGRLRAALRTVEIMQVELSREQMDMCDFCFMPPLETFSWVDVRRLRQIYDIGCEYAASEINRLVDILKHL